MAAKPGLYHLPAGTSLKTLLSISGGTTNDADVEEIAIHSRAGVSEIKDLKKISSLAVDYKLQGGEMVYIPKYEGLFTQPTVQSVTVITSIVSILLSIYFVNETRD